MMYELHSAVVSVEMGGAKERKISLVMHRAREGEVCDIGEG